MRNAMRLLSAVVLGIIVTGCAGSGSRTQRTQDPRPQSDNMVTDAPANVREQVRETEATPSQPAQASQPDSTTERPRPSAMKPDDSEVPAEVRAIEAVIDRPAVLLADEVRIEVSKNYEWDVSLSGDGVAPQRPDNGGTVTEAVGGPRAWFRNLDIRARDKIVFWRSGLNVTPFIKVTARGNVSYIDAHSNNGSPSLTRAGACKIDNASISFDDEAVGIPSRRPVSSPNGMRGTSGR